MIEETTRRCHEGGPRKITPFFVPGSIINMISGLVSIHYGYKGPNLATVSACSTANHSLGEAARLIEYGDADVMIAGGSEATVNRHRRRRLLRGARAVDPQRRSGDGQPALGRGPRRFRARRGCRRAGARGARARAGARRAHLRGARRLRHERRRPPHHRAARGWRRGAPQHAERAAQRGARARPTSTTSTRTARRRRSATSRSASRCDARSATMRTSSR